MTPSTHDLIIADHKIKPGATKDIFLKVSETYTATDIKMPIRVIRSKKPGPTVFVTAAVHGDEVNGTGIIHELMYQENLELLKGNLILIPIVNVFGFETSDRYMPDRRDLNRSFPGSPTGSLASRHANILMEEIISKCDYGIDLHSAAFQRTNYPNVRVDTSSKKALELAMNFGTFLIIDGKGPDGSLRRESNKKGCPTIILEAGETHKIEPTMLKIGLRGVENVLITLGMIEGTVQTPETQIVIKKSTWVRAKLGGIIRFNVTPGSIVKKGDDIATNFTIFGIEQNKITSPVNGVVMGLATLPAVKPGEPIVHIGLGGKQLPKVIKSLAKTTDKLHAMAKRDLATNISVMDL